MKYSSLIQNNFVVIINLKDMEGWRLLGKVLKS